MGCESCQLICLLDAQGPYGEANCWPAMPTTYTVLQSVLPTKRWSWWKNTLHESENPGQLFVIISLVLNHKYSWSAIEGKPIKWKGNRDEQCDITQKRDNSLTKETSGKVLISNVSSCKGMRILFMRASCSWPNYLPKAPPPNNIPLGGRILIYEVWRDANTQPTTVI